jgi:hypothetical protein
MPPVSAGGHERIQRRDTGEAAQAKSIGMGVIPGENMRDTA